MNGRDQHGIVASALSVASRPFASAADGISLTSTVTPNGRGHHREERIALTREQQLDVISRTFHGSL